MTENGNPTGWFMTLFFFTLPNITQKWLIVLLHWPMDTNDTKDWGLKMSQVLAPQTGSLNGHQAGTMRQKNTRWLSFMIDEIGYVKEQCTPKALGLEGVLFWITHPERMGTLYQGKVERISFPTDLICMSKISFGRVFGFFASGPFC